MKIVFSRFGAMVTLLWLCACAHVQPGQTPPDPDPFEAFNRPIFAFNKRIDTYVLTPVASSYKAVLPHWIRQRVTNFFTNIHELSSSVNHYFQGDIHAGSANLARLMLNSTLGLAGLFDVADNLGVPSKQTSFGETMVVWGGNYSPYIVVPFLGPSTIRDLSGRLPDWYLSPYPYIDEDIRRVAIPIEIVNQRANLLDKQSLVDTVAIDEYLFIRNAYLQRANRKNPVDGDEFETEDFVSETAP